MGGRLAVYFIVGGLAAAHCAVIFWPPLPCLTIHRLPDDTVSAHASVTGYSNPGESSRPLIMGSLHPPRSWCPFQVRDPPDWPSPRGFIRHRFFLLLASRS